MSQKQPFLFTQPVWIIGNGILGLSIAEYISRFSNKVNIISDENPLSGSYAAAANLATKGQLQGRQQHFQFKLDAKNLYPQWIYNLKKEINDKNVMDEVFRVGKGLDVFSFQEQRDIQYKRVYQETINKSPIQKLDKNKITYEDEMWIDAPFLLDLLIKCLKKRMVKFQNNKFNKETLDEIKKIAPYSTIIFCTGAWTKSLLENLNITLPISFQKAERLTIGSSFYTANKDNNSFLDKYVLIDHINDDTKLKFTLSGSQAKTWISSSTIKIKTLNYVEQNMVQLEEINKYLKNQAQNKLSTNSDFTIQTGLRVGYGHSELVLEEVFSSHFSGKMIVCCGAHKSGYLLAPLLGKAIISLKLGSDS